MRSLASLFANRTYAFGRRTHRGPSISEGLSITEKPTNDLQSTLVPDSGATPSSPMLAAGTRLRFRPETAPHPAWTCRVAPGALSGREGRGAGASRFRHRELREMKMQPALERALKQQGEPQGVSSRRDSKTGSPSASCQCGLSSRNLHFSTM